jgi:hypothetical protein
MFEHCPKCQHTPLPADQSLPAACPACGVILAKVGQMASRQNQDPLGASVGLWLLGRAHMVGGLTHLMGALVVLASLGWGAYLIRKAWRTTD